MVVSQFKDIKITALAAVVPRTKRNVFEYVLDDNEKKQADRFIKKIGVHSFYKANLNQTTADRCYVAAREILREKHIDVNDIGLLVLVTQEPDYVLPATACVIHKRLGLSEDCMAFDINLGCSGFTYGINVVASLMRSSNIKKALLLCGDTSTIRDNDEESNKKTHSQKWLFGDAGSALLLEKGGTSQIKVVSRTDGNGYKAIINPKGPRHADYNEGTQMDEVAVFSFAISQVPIMINEMFEICGTTPNDYDALALHQANLFIMKQIAKKTGFPLEKLLVSLDEYGNTSSASIPLSLAKEYGMDDNDKNIKIIACGYGVGLSWSCVEFEISKKDIFPIIKSDEYFDDEI